MNPLRTNRAQQALKRLRKKQGCSTPGSRDAHCKGQKGPNTVLVFVPLRSLNGLLTKDTVFWNVTPCCLVKNVERRLVRKFSN